MTEESTGAPLVQELPWDSDFFGLPIGRVPLDRPSPTDVAEAIGAARRSGVACLYLTCAADEVVGVTAAVRGGFRVVDVRVTLDRSMEPTEQTVATAERGATVPPSTRRAQDSDLPRLAPLARTAFQESRFFVDGRFPRSRVEDLYQRWLERDYSSADGVVVVEDVETSGGKTAGFASGLLPGDTARVGLVAVAPEFRGQGIGSRIVSGLLREFAGRRARRTVVVTQARNRAAIRLYEEVGFRASAIEVTLHWWADENPV